MIQGVPTRATFPPARPVDVADVPALPPPADEAGTELMDEAQAPRRWGPRLVTGALGAAAVAWLATLGWLLATGAPARGIAPLQVAAWVGLGSGPLALLALVYLLLLRTGRGEATAYARATVRLRAESEALGETLATLGERIDGARRDLGQQAEQLATLGLDAGARLTDAAGTLGTQADAFARTAAGLDEATATARADLGVLLHDLPQADAAARALAERLRETGGEAEARTRALATVADELRIRAEAAGDAGGQSAARLTAELARMETGTTALDHRLAETSRTMTRTVDDALAAAAEGVEQTRAGMAAQAAALAAIVADARASLAQAGETAGDALVARLDALAGNVARIGTGLEVQETQAAALHDRIDRALALARGDGAAQIAGLAAQAETATRALEQGERTAATMLDRVTRLREQADAGSVAIGETIPSALARVRLHADQGLQAITAASERGTALEATASAVTERLAEADALLAQQRATLDEVGTLAGQRLQTLLGHTAALEEALGQAHAAMRALSEGASAELVDALLRVRDTAAQAADHARDALTAAIPRAAQRLGESAARAMTLAVAEVGRGEMASLGAASARAVEAAEGAADRLGLQLRAIAETSTAIEGRIAANAADTEAHDQASFARAVGLLIDALNSSAIDVVRLLGTEVGDDAWRSYLRGDRGVFTRRAIRLVDRQEAGEIARRYREEAAFGELVNRYVHDFEAMLRRMMALPDGIGIATAVLSSDAGKLYVALAQAIERLRR